MTRYGVLSGMRKAMDWKKRGVVGIIF